MVLENARVIWVGVRTRKSLNTFAFISAEVKWRITFKGVILAPVTIDEIYILAVSA